MSDARSRVKSRARRFPVLAPEICSCGARRLTRAVLHAADDAPSATTVTSEAGLAFAGASHGPSKPACKSLIRRELRPVRRHYRTKCRIGQRQPVSTNPTTKREQPGPVVTEISLELLAL